MTYGVVKRHFIAINQFRASDEMAGAIGGKDLQGIRRRHDFRARNALEPRVRVLRHAPDAAVALMHAGVVKHGNHLARRKVLFVLKPLRLRFKT